MSVPKEFVGLMSEPLFPQCNNTMKILGFAVKEEKIDYICSKDTLTEEDPSYLLSMEEEGITGMVKIEPECPNSENELISPIYKPKSELEIVSKRLKVIERNGKCGVGPAVYDITLDWYQNVSQLREASLKSENSNNEDENEWIIKQEEVEIIVQDLKLNSAPSGCQENQEDVAHQDKDFFQESNDTTEISGAIVVKEEMSDNIHPSIEAVTKLEPLCPTLEMKENTGTFIMEIKNERNNSESESCPVSSSICKREAELIIPLKKFKVSEKNGDCILYHSSAICNTSIDSASSSDFGQEDCAIPQDNDSQAVWQENKINHLIDDRNPLKNPIFRCDQCNYETIRNYDIKRHSTIHEQGKKVDALAFNQYYHRTNVKTDFTKHSVIRTKLEKDIFHCTHCNFQTKYKSNFKFHLLRHKYPNEIDKLRCLEIFKCDQCSYQTIQKSYLKKHSIVHKNPEDIVMFKCTHCNFQSKRKTSLNYHLLLFHNSGKINMFECDQCSYQTMRKSHLRLHSYIHKIPEGTSMFKCDQCSYESFRKSHLKRHSLVHNSDMLKCAHCDFQTKRKEYLKQHLFRRHNSGTLHMFKCNQCSYQTVNKNDLTRHSYVHKTFDEKNCFKCVQCSYQTIQKRYLKQHLATHRKSDKLDV